MGYYINQRGDKFRIESDQVGEAFLTLQHYASEHGMAWVCRDACENASDFKNLMSECRWDIQIDQNGTVIWISFNGEKSGDQDQVLKVLAPYVKSRSWIEMQGEGGVVWRYAFYKGTFKEVEGILTFDMPWDED